MKKRNWAVIALVLLALICVLFTHFVYHTIAWTWGGDKQGESVGEGYLIFSSIFPCLTMFGTVIYAIQRLRKHLECHVEVPENCHKIGHLVNGGAYRACHDHNPAVEHEQGEPITAEHIRASHLRHSIHPIRSASDG